MTASDDEREDQEMKAMVRKPVAENKSIRKGKKTPAQNREAKQRYKERHPERVKAQAKVSGQRNHQKNRQRRLVIMAAYRSKDVNKKKHAAYMATYVPNRRAHDPIFRLKDTIRARLSAFLNGKGTTKNASTFTLVGCTATELILHLGDTPKAGSKHVDHIFPLDCHPLETLDEQMKAQHFSNLQLLTLEENLSKSSKLPTKAMAAKVARWAWPDGVTEDMLPDIYPGWSTALRM